MRAAAPQTRFHDDITQTASWRHAALGAVLVAFAAALPSAAVNAQSTNRSDARPCTEIEVDAERLACYDRALRSARPAAPAAAAAAAADQQARRRNRETEAPAAPTPPAAPVAAAAPAPAPAPKAESRHSRSDAKETKNADAVESVVVVNVRGRPGENTFTTDKGATWVQIDGRSTTLPNLPFAATVKPGLSSSFFLVPTKGRAIRVRPGD